MNGVTIDRIDIKAHERYANDQKNLDPKYLIENGWLPSQSEIAGTSAIYSSKWEELFEIHVRNIPWAAFSPPPRYNSQKNKFFSHCIVPHMSFDQEKDQEEDDDNEKEKEDSKLEEIKQLILAQKTAQISSALEKDKTSLFDLLHSVQWLTLLLKEVNARKLQYQKG